MAVPMDITSLLPLFQETVDKIRARIDADVNAGIDPAQPGFIDTTEGGFYYDITQPCVIELARLYDAMATEVPAAVIPLFTFGRYLDYWGDVVGLSRKDAVRAIGVVRFTGTVGTLVAPGTQVSTLQTDPEVDPPIFRVVAGGGGTIGALGYIDLTVEAVTAGTDSNVASGTVTVLLTPNPEITATTNPAAISGGADVETDELFGARVLLEFSQPPGAGNQADYERWALAYPGVGFATVQPVWNGPGTVRVIVTDVDNNPVATEIVTGLQATLDPLPEEGAGEAPIGAIVTVATPTAVTVNVSATVEFDSGYSLDGTAGTIALEDAIVTAVTRYIDGLRAGQEVVYRHVEARFFSVEGVHDISSLLLNGAATNVTITGLQVANVGTVTLA